MLSEFNPSIVTRSTLPLSLHEVSYAGDHLPSDFNTSIVIRPAQHIVPHICGITRTRLQRQLSQAATRPVTLLIAGSGAGKTNALAQFCREQTQTIPIWYSLDGDDVDPDTLLARLFWALAAAVPSLRERLDQDAIALQNDPGDWTDVLARWLDALCDSPKPILLCIDGLSDLDARLTPLFDQLIRCLHPRLHVVMAFRTQPPATFWAGCLRLRSHGHLALLSDDVFRFSAAEARKLCARYGYTASQQDVLSLCNLARGWAYLLDWVLRAHRGRPIADVLETLALIESAADLDTAIEASLRASFGSEEFEQLVCSSIPSRLTPASIAAVCGLAEQHVALERWHAAIPALHEIAPGTYVYHRLFRAFLRRCFLRLPVERRTVAVHASADAAIVVGDWSEATAQLIAHGDSAALCRALEPRAAKLVLDRRLDGAMTEIMSLLVDSAAWATSPWLLSYQAMECRISRGDYAATCRLGRMAITQFEHLGDNNGRARVLAELAIARYHMGQYSVALAELTSCPPPTEPICMVALLLATYLNYAGISALSEALEAAHRGLQLLEHEPDTLRRISWSIALQRNLAIAYHFRGELDAARKVAEGALQLAKQYYARTYTYDWSLYDLGLLEQRAGRLTQALSYLRRARAHVERSANREPLRRWIVVAEGHVLRDLGDLEAAEERYRLGGWGEGDEGPLMLWLLQGQHAEARLAVEARLTAAHASASSFEALNLKVIGALLDLEAGATPTIHAILHTAAQHYAALGFRYHRAGVQFHLAAVEYALGEMEAGDRTLAEALDFGASHGYLNFTWWHPARMRALLSRALRAGIEREYSARLLRERGLVQQPDNTPVIAAGQALITQTPATQQRRATLHLHCLGYFEAQVDGRVLPREHWKGHRAGAVRMQRMLLHLARHRDPQPLDAIVRYVWPDVWNRIDVSSNFHLTLAGLRRVFEPDLDQGCSSRFVLTTPQGYQLLPTLEPTIDLDQFLAYAHEARLADAAGDHAAARAAFEQAEQLYNGDFALAKPDPGEAEEYHRTVLEAVRWLAHDDLRHGMFDSCISRARRLLCEDSWDSTAATLLIAAYLNRGNRRAARQQYERFVQRHGQPSPEIVQLARAHWL